MLNEDANKITPEQAKELLIENAQLRDVVTQFDSDFFKRKCCVCGCDWNHPCEGGCFWVGDDLCSKCAEDIFRNKRRKIKRNCHL